MKSNIKKLALVVIEAMMLFFGVACQKEIEPDEVPIDNYKSVVVGSIRLDTTRKCVSKKWHYAEESSVYVYNKDGKTGKTYKTIRLMSEDLRIIQEWMVEYLHNNVVSDCQSNKIVLEKGMWVNMSFVILFFLKVDMCQNGILVNI